MEIPLLYYDESGEEIFNIDCLRDIFRTVGNRQFVILSINGLRRTGKSYLLTRLLRGLIQNTEFINTEWRMNPENTVVGIHIWSQPIQIKKEDGTEICIILLHTQGNFDPPATVLQNAKIFALSAILSSFFILNVKKNISKDTLEFLQYYLNLAKSFDQSPNTPPQFQRILFLIRDMDLRIKDFAHGYHNSTSKPPSTALSQTNLFTQIFTIDPTRQPLEIQHTYRQVLSSFKDIGLFAVPEPRSIFRSANQNRERDLEFQNYIQTFLDLILPSQGLLIHETKRMGDMSLTGDEYLVTLDNLERSITRIRPLELSADPFRLNRGEMQNIISKSNLLSLYVSTITDFMSEQSRNNSNTKGIYQKTLAEKMNSFLKICLDTFSRRLSQGDVDLKEKYRETLCEEIQEKMKLFESLNDTKIKFSRQQQVLNSEMNSLLDKLTNLRIQLDEEENRGRVEIWEDVNVHKEIDRRLRKSHCIHLQKLIEDLQGKISRLRERISEAQAQNEEALKQITKLIQNIATF